MSVGKNEKLKFTPRYSLYTKDNKKIPFNIYSDFDFKSIKNIIALKLITPIAKICVKLLSIIKSNNITFKTNNVSNIGLTLFGLIKNNVLDLKNTVSPSVKFNALIDNNTVDFQTKSNSKATVKIKSSVQENEVELINSSNDKLILCTKSSMMLKLINTISINAKILAQTSENQIVINKYVYPSFKLLATTLLKDYANLKTSGFAISKFLTSTYNNKINLKSIGNATVYRPIMLKELYPQKIADWYDKTLDEVFYGEELF